MNAIRTFFAWRARSRQRFWRATHPTTVHRQRSQAQEIADALGGRHRR